MIIGKKDREYVFSLEEEIAELKARIANQISSIQSFCGESEKYRKSLEHTTAKLHAIQMRAASFLTDVKKIIEEN